MIQIVLTVSAVVAALILFLRTTWNIIDRSLLYIALLAVLSLSLSTGCTRLNYIAGSSLKSAEFGGTLGGAIGSAPGVAIGLIAGGVTGAVLGLTSPLPATPTETPATVITREEMAAILIEQHPDDATYRPSSDELDQAFAARYNMPR